MPAQPASAASAPDRHEKPFEVTWLGEAEPDVERR
jgi:hypothetical protein